MTGAVLEMKWDDAALRDAARRLITFDNDRAAKMWDALGHLTVSQSLMRWETQTDPTGAAWIQSQRAKKTGGQTLYEKGFLYASMTYNVLGGSGIEEGSNRPYAGMMQFGGDITMYARGQDIYRNAKRIKQVERSGKTMRTNAAGEEIGVNLSPYQFVKKNSKGSFATHVEIGEHTIHIEARPYLGISQDDGVEITAVALRHLEYALLGTRP